ncbi:hypothetical protein [Tahibacter sp.]|uniref:RCC1-like domain-containing protein n=1 Tax=Tahibacter sp. TaxID=2056211 RepID=UPI0028C3B615|nr:hypothetical protein [Tahibacter sp.]
MGIQHFTRLGIILAGLAILLSTTTAAGAALIAAGGAHTCAISESDRGLYCWGLASSGQLSNGSAADRASPVAVVSPIAAWQAVAAGDTHTCAIAASGAVYCWGANQFGQLGDGTLVNRAQPVAVVGLTSGVRELAVGLAHSCALMQSGRINCWGNGGGGRLGSGASMNQATPGEVLSITNAVAIGAGAAHGCAVLADATMKCWGANTYGELGDGTTTMHDIPVFVSIGVPVAEIALAQFHTCARSTAAAVLCWGRNNVGQVGDGTIVQRQTPTAVSGLSSGVSALSAGGHHTCARIGTTALKCWGYNANAQLGNATTIDSRVPVDVLTLAAPIGEIASGTAHSCARSGRGNRVRCWGSLANGRTAIGNITVVGNANQAVTISGLPAPARQVSMRTRTSCATTDRGSASCWGRNNLSQLGAGTAIDHTGARFVQGLQNGVSSVAIGENHGCAVRTDGTVWCWGDNAQGQIGDQTTIARPIAVQTVGIVDAVQIVSGPYFSCARTVGGGVWCWGQNTDGQLGNGSTTNSAQAVIPVGLAGGVIDLSAGDRHACAVCNDGTVRCWGYNMNGQVGDGTLVSRNVPTAVNDSFATYVAVAAGGLHTCGLTTSGQAKCWGSNAYGQLGDGSLITRASPAGVATLSSGVLQIAAGDYHSCALLSGGALRCWGRNNLYQLGDDTQIDRLQPVAATNVAGPVRHVTLGAQASCVLRGVGSAQCWGLNNFGQLGNGSIATPWRLPDEISRWIIDDLIFRDGFSS